MWVIFMSRKAILILLPYCATPYPFLSMHKKHTRLQISFSNLILYFITLTFTKTTTVVTNFGFQRTWVLIILGRIHKCRGWRYGVAG